MNCSAREFETRIWAKYPHKVLHTDVGPDCSVYIFAFDHVSFASLDHAKKNFHADYVWNAGAVVKDTTGLFISNQSTGNTVMNYTVTVPVLQNAVPASPYFTNQMFDMEDAGIFPLKSKCTCGCASIGSNNHSSWCDIKEMNNVVVETDK